MVLFDCFSATRWGVRSSRGGSSFCLPRFAPTATDGSLLVQRKRCKRNTPHASSLKNIHKNRSLRDSLRFSTLKHCLPRFAPTATVGSSLFSCFSKHFSSRSFGYRGPCGNVAALVTTIAVLVNLTVLSINSNYIRNPFVHSELTDSYTSMLF